LTVKISNYVMAGVTNWNFSLSLVKDYLEVYADHVEIRF